jgi:hypothetical protein
MDEIQNSIAGRKRIAQRLRRGREPIVTMR